MLRLFICWLSVTFPVACWAQVGSLASNAGFAPARGLMQQAAVAAEQSVTRASLFIGQERGGFFAPIVRDELGRLNSPAVRHLRNIIGQAESPAAGYDAVQHGAAIKPLKPPTQMTIGEIFEWIRATPGQPHAIGRYQFIPDTLERVVAQVGAKAHERFSPEMQDRLADVLLEDAGFSAFLAGDLSQTRFMNNLASIWAGLPTSSGRSKYHGFAGNRATVTLAYFQSEIAKIAPGS
ncbi:hypothetical protein TW80_09830 [Loktanella sp. S4079]|nr:hypothetical protein TW80_09830 [Loktanella sp. S4079]